MKTNKNLRIILIAGVSGLLATAIANYDRLIPHRWHTYVATDATFSIDFPSQTTLDTEPISSEDGTTIDSLTIFAQPTKYTAYSCTYIDKKYAPESSPQKILESARDGSLTKLKGTVISQKNMVIQGFPALDTQAHARDNMLVDLRLILVKDRMFMLMTMASSEENQESKTNQRFFDSFKILRNQ